MLKGKAKEDFDDWLIESQIMNYPMWVGVNRFYDQHPSMQYGVIVDFFDSVGINIEAFRRKNFISSYKYVSRVDWVRVSEYSKTRNEAQTKAIEKAVELYNSKT